MTSLAAIHVGKKSLGLDDDTYRAMLLRVTGKQSAADLNENERKKVVEEMRKAGFKPVLKTSRKPLEGKYAKKLQAMWIAGYNLGIIKDRDDTALIAFVKRQTGIDHVRFLRDGDDANKAIEALKKWLARDGGVDWEISGLDQDDYRRSFGYKIAFAQWKKYEVPLDLKPFWQEVEYILKKGIQKDFSDQDWQKVMNAFGLKIRKAQKDGCL